MNKQTALDRRLTRAVHEAADAERVWRIAMVRNVDEQAEHPEIRRRLDALWQERERARIRVLELQWLAHVRAERFVGIAGRLRSTKATIGVLRWHAGRRLGSRPLRRTA